MPTLSIDKSKCWFGFLPDAIAHVYYGEHRLCDSEPSGSTAQPVITTSPRTVCPRCIMLLNTANHEKRGAHYGS